MFRSSTIMKELALNLAKVTFILNHSVKLCRYLICGCVAACHGMACVFYADKNAQSHILISTFWRRGFQDLDLFQWWGHIKSAVELMMQNENSLTHLQQITCIPKAYVIHILSLTRSCIDPLFFAAQDEDSNHHDVCSLLQQDGSIPHFYDIIPG